MAAPILCDKNCLSPIFAIERAVLHGFGEVDILDFFGSGEIRDGARDLDHARGGAVGQTHRAASLGEQRVRCARHMAMQRERTGVQACIGANGRIGIARGLKLPRGHHPRPDWNDEPLEER